MTKYTSSWPRMAASTEYDIVAQRLDANQYGLSDVENAQIRLDTCAEFLCNLTSMLHQKGILSSEDVAELTGTQLSEGHQ